MEKTMKFYKVFTITVAIVFCIGLQSGYADETLPLFDVSNDGREVLVVETDSGADQGISHPFAGAEDVTEDALIEAGVDITPLSEAEIEELDALPPLTGGIEDENTEVIHRIDSRVRVYPATSPIARKIGLFTSNRGRCTAWLINRNTVATAGHCVHGGRGRGWYRNFRFFPRHATGLGVCTIRRVWSNTNWTRFSNERFDYAVAKLNCNVGRLVGWWGYFWRFGSLNNLHIIIPGYPGDKPSWQQWWGVDRVRVTQPQQIFYLADTNGGMSGSPVGGDEIVARTGPTRIYAIGIHTKGKHGFWPHRFYNHGTRITRSVADFFLRHKLE